MGAFEDIAPEADIQTLTGQEIRMFIESMVQESQVGVDPSQLKKSLKGLKFPVAITDA